jgi:large subunit ribosomal protein L20
MARVKRSKIAMKHRRNVLKRAKGYQFGRSKKEVEAKVALRKAGAHAFAHRRDKKNDMRKLWNVKMNAALRELGTTYSKFINALKKKDIKLDRKILADLAENHPTIFNKVVEATK